LIKHALKALSATLSGDTELDSKSASISIVGKDKMFEIIEGPALQVYLDAIEVDGGAGAMDEEILENPEV
jgi:20S proteasome subunit alpha 6